MRILGIDPGQSGGLVLIDQDANVIKKSTMPIDSQKDLDKLAFLELLSLWKATGEFHVYLERIIPFAMNAKSALTFGKQLGMIEFVLWDRKYPFTLIEATKWTKEMHQGVSQDIKPKVRSGLVIERLFPGLDLRGTPASKKNHEGLVDALLIAEYGRRQLCKT